MTAFDESATRPEIDAAGVCAEVAITTITRKTKARTGTRHSIASASSRQRLMSSGSIDRHADAGNDPLVWVSGFATRQMGLEPRRGPSVTAGSVRTDNH